MHIFYYFFTSFTHVFTNKYWDGDTAWILFNISVYVEVAYTHFMLYSSTKTVRFATS